MTIKQARQHLGEPGVEANTGSRRVWKYHRPKGFVQIGHEDQGSGIIPFYYWWVLRAYPNDQSPQAIFSAEVVDRLPANERRYEAVILNQCRLPMVEVIINEGKVQLITWIDNPGSYRPGNNRVGD